MRKKLLSMILALCFVLTLLPVTALAVDLTTLYIGSNAAVTLPSTDGYYTYGTNSGGAGTASNQETLPADGWTWAVQYNAGALVKYTLTLNNAAITTNYSTSGSLMAAIYADGDLDVVLLGDNTVTGLDGINSSSSSFGVYVSGSLTVGGSGSLTTSAGKAAFAMSGGIYATNSITISGGTITAIGGYGDRSFGLGTINNGGDSIAISGGTVTAIGSETGGSSSCGIWTYTVSITGGIVTATGIINGVSANTININNGEGDGLLIAKGRQDAATSVPTYGSGSAALSGLPSDYTGVWGVSAIYPSTNILNSTLNLSTWSDDATTHWNASTGGYKTETVGEVKTLTLKNVIINTPDNSSENNWGIILPSENVNIVLEGVNIVNAGNANSSSYSYGIWGDGSNVSVTGDTLIALSGMGGISSGLYAGASLSLESAKVVALSDRTYPNNSSSAIRSDGAITISGGTTIAVGKGENGNSVGIQSGGNLSITGGTTIAVGVNGFNCYGVYAKGTESSVSNVSITGGITIPAGITGGSNSYGVYATGSINITGGCGAAFTSGVYPGVSKIAFVNSPQGNETYVPVLTAGSWTGNSADWKVMEVTPTPEATVDYENEKLKDLTSNAAYLLNSEDVTADEDGKIAITNAWFGSTISLVKKGNGTYTVNSATQHITLAARPSAPSCTAVQPSASSATGTVSGITTVMQYSTNGGTSWNDGTGTDVTDLNPGTVLIRVKAVGNSTPAGLSQSITLTAYNSTPAATPDATFTATGADTGTLSNVTNTMKYSVDGGSNWQSITGTTMMIAGVTAANGVKVYQPGNGSSTTDSAAQSISVTKAVTPTAVGKTDCTTAANNNGKLTSVTAAMEYKLSTASEWIGGTGSDITGLANGTYYVRVKAAGTVLASDAQNLTIAAYSAPPSDGGGSSYTPLVTRIDSGGSTTGSNIEKLVSGGKTLTVEADKGAKLVFDTDALKGIGGQTTGEIKVVMKDVSPEHQESLPDKLVFSLTVSSGSSTISNFGGSVEVSLPYELKNGETADEVTVWYLTSDGTMTEIPCTYNPVTKLATFKVTHFSLYVVGVDTPWVNPFTDVSETDWFYGAVEFVSSNGMMEGIGGTDFSPNTTVTRGMLVTILWRLENEPVATKTISFTDVTDGKWYAKAVDWAAAQNIVTGYAGNFNPDDALTREQLAAILYRYAAYKNYDVSAADSLSAYADKPSDWALSSVSWAVAEGLIKGSDGNLDLRGSATRAQAATILQRFIENMAK